MVPTLHFVILAGPTATGKTALGVELAEEYGAEIVGADAFQIYDGLDTLSAKPGPEERRRVPHRLIGTVPLAQRYDARQYGEEARRAIWQVNAAGKVALVVGGTGFYLEALTSRLPDLPPPDPDLRAELATMSLGELVGALRRLDPASHARIDRLNPRRVQRALEVCLQTGKPFSAFAPVPESHAAPRFALRCARPELDTRIGHRVERMFAAGVVDEVAAAPACGPTAAKMIGLHAIHRLLQGIGTETECRESLCRQTRQYAKRQETWFRGRDYLLVDPPAARTQLSAALAAARARLTRTRDGFA